MKPQILSIAAIGTLAITSLQAQSVVETFNYTPGTINQTATTGTGQTGNWSANYNSAANATADFVSKTWLSSGITNYTASTGTVGLTGDTNGDRGVFQMSSSIDFDSNGTYYFSYLQRRDTTGGNGVFALSNNTQGFFNDLVRVNNVGGTAIVSGLDNVSGGTPVTGTNIFTNTTADWLVIGRITTVAAGNDTFELAAVADGGTVAATFDSLTGIDTIQDTVTGSANYVGFWNFNDTNTMTFGSVRIGDTYAAVIPEPSSFALLAGAFGLLTVLRRRRA